MKKLFFTLVYFLIFSILYSQSTDAELISHTTHISIDNGKLIKTEENEIIIYKREGERHCDIYIPVYGLEKLNDITAYISTLDGQMIRKLKKKDILSRSWRSRGALYTDDLIKEFSLKHNEYPYRIFYSYTIEKTEFISVDYWLPILDEETPTQTAVLNLDIPKDYQINYSQQFIQSFSMDSLDDRYHYQWTASYKDSLDEENYAPELENYLPSVTIMPQSFFYEISGSLKTWTSYGQWQTDLMEGLSELPSSEKEMILSLTKGVENEREKIKILYEHLQKETRYINVSVETGGLKPYPAAYVCENKYGDCKALTFYFKSILDFIGVESLYANVYADDKNMAIDMELPGPQFNHIILCVPQPEDTIWLDCTSDAAFNYLGTFTQGRKAFIINGEESTFLATPELKKEEVMESRNVTTFLNPKNKAESEFHFLFKGDKYESLYYISQKLNQEDKKEYLEDYYMQKGYHIKDQFVILSIPDLPEIGLSYIATSTNVYQSYGNDLMVKVMPFEIPDFTKATSRMYPVQIDYPIYKTDTLKYKLPSGFQNPDYPRVEHIESKYGSYDHHIRFQDDWMIVEKSFYLKAGDIPIESYEEFYEFIISAKKAQKKLRIIISK